MSMTRKTLVWEGSVKIFALIGDFLGDWAWKSAKFKIEKVKNELYLCMCACVYFSDTKFYNQLPDYLAKCWNVCIGQNAEIGTVSGDKFVFRQN